MRTANWAAAADYINETYGQGLKQPLASLDSLAFSRPGVIEFKVYASIFGPAALPDLKDRLIAAHGADTVAERSGNHIAYIWQLTPDRAVVCGYRYGKGLYIQLKDDGN